MPGVTIKSIIRLIGAEAWQDCRQLRIVKLPATVVGIADNAFRDCKLLNSVSAPGCRNFGYKALGHFSVVGKCLLWEKSSCGCRPLKGKGCTQEQTANGLTRCFFQGLKGTQVQK